MSVKRKVQGIAHRYLNEKQAGIFEAPPSIVKMVENWVLATYSEYVFTHARESAPALAAKRVEEVKSNVPHMLKRIVKLNTLKAGRVRVFIFPERDGTQFRVRTLHPHEAQKAVKTMSPRVRKQWEQDNSLPVFWTGFGVNESFSDDWDQTKTYDLQEVSSAFQKYVRTRLIPDLEKTNEDIMGKARKYTGLHPGRLPDLRKEKKPSERLYLDWGALQGWKYLPRLVKEGKTKGEIEARLNLRWNPYLQVWAGFRGSQFLGRNTTGAWNTKGKVLAIALPEEIPETMRDFDKEVWKIKRTIRHESQHLGQQLLADLLEISEAGSSSKRLRGPEVDTSLHSMKDPWNQYVQTGVEFYPWLMDQVDEFLAKVEEELLRPNKEGIRYWVNQTNPFGVWKRENKPLWKKAVKEFIKELNKRGHRTMNEKQAATHRVLYHATPPTRIAEIMKQGLRSGGPSMRAQNLGQVGVSTTHKFSVVSGGNFGNAIIVLDPSKFPKSLTMKDVDYWGDGSEAEIRVIDESKPQTVIPPSAIKEIIHITPGMPLYEIRWIGKQGYRKPIFTYWKGKKEQVWPPGKAAARPIASEKQAGILEAPPALMKTLEDWMVGTYIGHVLSSIDVRRKENEARIEPIKAKMDAATRAHRKADRDIDALGEGETYVFPYLTGEGDPIKYYRLTQQEVENNTHRMESYDRQEWEKDKTTPFFWYWSAYHKEWEKSELYTSMSSFLDQAIHSEIMPFLKEEISEIREEIYDLDYVEEEAQKYGTAGKIYKSKTARKIPLDLSGWKYLKEIKDKLRVSVMILERADLRENLEVEVSARYIEKALERRYGWDKFTAILDFKGHKKRGGQWYSKNKTLEVDIIHPSPESDQDVVSGVEHIRRVIRHELQHVGQTLIHDIHGILGKYIKEWGGLPSKSIRTPDTTVWGDPTSEGKRKPGKGRIEHHQRDVEFYPVLADEVDAFLRRWRDVKWTGEEHLGQYIAQWVGSEKSGRHIDNSYRFMGWKKNNRPKWKKAVKEFYKELSKKGLKVKPRGGIRASVKLARLYLRRKVTQIASQYAQAAGDIQTLHYAQTWVNKAVNAFVGSQDDRQKALATAKKVNVFVSSSGSEVIVSIPDGFPKPDTSGLTERFTDVKVKKDAEAPSGWHIAHPSISERS